jgi:hypothetical protein
LILLDIKQDGHPGRFLTHSFHGIRQVDFETEAEKVDDASVQ